MSTTCTTVQAEIEHWPVGGVVAAACAAPPLSFRATTTAVIRRPPPSKATEHMIAELGRYLERQALAQQRDTVFASHRPGSSSDLHIDDP